MSGKKQESWKTYVTATKHNKIHRCYIGLNKTEWIKIYHPTITQAKVEVSFSRVSILCKSDNRTCKICIGSKWMKHCAHRHAG